MLKHPPANVGDPASVHGLGRFSGASRPRDQTCVSLLLHWLAGPLPRAPPGIAQGSLCCPTMVLLGPDGKSGPKSLERALCSKDTPSPAGPGSCPRASPCLPPCPGFLLSGRLTHLTQSPDQEVLSLQRTQVCCLCLLPLRAWPLGLVTGVQVPSLPLHCSLILGYHICVGFFF